MKNQTPNNQTPVTPPPEEVDDDIKPSKLPLQTVRPDVFVPIAPQQHVKEKKVFSITSKIMIIVGLLLSILAWNIWVLQPYFVDGESMFPTLNTKDTLLVSKLPQTWAGLTNTKYIPKRFDVVIVKNPQRPEENFVKRVIGLPGERVVVKDGVITVYNEESPRGINVTTPPCCNNLEETSGSVDTFVQEGHIFVVGDNRTPGGSIDSRSSLGQIPSSLISGRAVLRITPITQITIL